MPADNTPLTRERILAAAEDVIRRFGPARATVVDVARALGVTHAAVYRHVANKADLRQLVVKGWVETTMPPLRAIAERRGPAPKRLRQLFDALIAVKRRRAADDPELFAAYRTLAADAQAVTAAHVDELIGLTAMVIEAGTKEGTFRRVDPVTAARAVLIATSRFHHPVHWSVSTTAERRTSTASASTAEQSPQPVSASASSAKAIPSASSRRATSAQPAPRLSSSTIRSIPRIAISAITPWSRRKS